MVENQERLDEMKLLWENGLNLAMIGQIYGISRERVRQLFSRKGWNTKRRRRDPSPAIPKPKPELFPERNADIVARYQAGEGPSAIAHRHGIPPESLYAILRRHGVAPHRPHKGWLTEEQYESIRLRAAAGERYGVLAFDYDCSVSTIENVINGVHRPKKNRKWKQAFRE